jgi:hypothetical protein
MSINGDMFHLLNWELIPPIGELADVTEGNEVIEIYIQDSYGCQPPLRYTLPITRPGQSFALLRANLLYPKDRCTNTLRYIFVSIRIFRGYGYERRVIYTNDSIQVAPYYANGSVYRLPIHRVWSAQDYIQFMLGRLYFVGLNEFNARLFF